MQAGAIVDCHAHIIDPTRFSFDDGPGYMPSAEEGGTCEDYVTALDQSAVRHALLVQPSCYGFDNSALLDALRRYPNRFKSTAVIHPRVSDDELVSLAEAGVVGARFNLVSFDRDVFRRSETGKLLQRIKALGWFAEVVADDDDWRHAAPVLRGSGVRVLIDHFGTTAIGRGLTDPGFQAVLELGGEGNAVVKLSTPFALGIPRGQHNLVDPFVAALLNAFGTDRCVWGSDWPFLAVSDPPDLPEALRYLQGWVPNPMDRNKILWSNPVRLFGFQASENA